ncbi:hypothetical protein [Haliangium ochraceum]|uniref:hypothetical protein n=1 Tax=Haliangium ochraceum TaxID=80816 RepID=UPI00019BA6B0|nr:hypothetical protein [Haliangium ochraceum]
MRVGLERLRLAGHALVVVLGHPDYYPRFGFGRASALGLRWEYEARGEAFMAIALAPDTRPTPRGVVAYRGEFNAM